MQLQGITLTDVLPHLYRGLWTGEGSQRPDDVESGEVVGGGGVEGAGQDDKIPSSHLQTGFSHGYPKRS